jgi:hypothetical protein
MYVGHHFKFAKSFHAIEVGNDIKPIINPLLDKYDLISNGFAVDESTIPDNLKFKISNL